MKNQIPCPNKPYTENNGKTWVCRQCGNEDKFKLMYKERGFCTFSQEGRSVTQFEKLDRSFEEKPYKCCECGSEHIVKLEDIMRENRRSCVTMDRNQGSYAYGTSGSRYVYYYSPNSTTTYRY